MIQWLARKAKRLISTQKIQSHMLAVALLCWAGFYVILPGMAQGLAQENSNQPAQTTNLEAALTTGTVLANAYILDVGDEIRIEDTITGNLTSLDFTNSQSASDTTRISDEGLVDLPLIGPIRLSGLSISTAQDILNRRYATLLQQPHITIQVVSQRPIRVYVQGAVSHPGVYINGKNTQPENKDHAALGGTDATEIYAQYHLTDALIQAGGLKANANYQDVRIYRGFPDPQVIHVNLWQLFQQGESAGDLALEEHDRIEVPALPASQLAFSEDWKSISRTNLGVSLFQVSVIGAVKQPGTYPLSARDNAIAAIAQAGGFSATANQKSVYLLRSNEQGQVFKKQLDASDTRLMGQNASLWPSLLPGDVIFVDDASGRQALALGKVLIDRTAGASLLPFFSSLSASKKK